MNISSTTLEIFSSLEHKWLSHSHPRNKTTILTIDGGGTNCIVSSAALVLLEHHIRTISGNPTSRISDYFDLIAATGTGAILAALITAKDSNNRPLFSAREASRFATENNADLFKPSGIFRRRGFSADSTEKMLKKALRKPDGKALTLRDTCKPLLIPCFDLNTTAPFVFSRADALESTSFDFELWRICRATSSNPSIYPPFPLKSIDGQTSLLAVDGGLVMNNPSVAAVTHVLHNKRDFPAVNGIGDLSVLSIGNGIRNPNYRRRWGLLSASAMVDIVNDGLSETVDQFLGNAFRWNRTGYVRVQGMKERGVEAMEFGGKRMVTETNGERMGKFVERIVAGRKSSLPPSPCKPVTIATTLVNGR